MHFLTVLPLLYSLNLVLIPIQAFDPFSAGAAVVGGIAAIGSNVFCRYRECCDKPWISHNFKNLSKSLKYNLFGQHLVQKNVVKLIRNHLTNRKSQKPLVLSFHGGTGTGKTWVSKLISESLYKEGMNSKFVEFIHVPNWFRDPGKTREQTEILHHTIKSTLKECKYSLFIFDDIHVINPKVLDELIVYMNYHPPPMDGLDLTKAIYILIGNSGATRINDFTIQQFRDGRDRNSIRMKEIQNFASDTIFSEEYAFQDTRIVSEHIIDIIPFLPLERIHVKSCIERAVEEMDREVTESLIEQVMEGIRFVPEDLDRFAEFGCRIIGHLESDFP